MKSSNPESTDSSESQYQSDEQPPETSDQLVLRLPVGAHMRVVLSPQSDPTESSSEQSVERVESLTQTGDGSSPAVQSVRIPIRSGQGLTIDISWPQAPPLLNVRSAFASLASRLRERVAHWPYGLQITLFFLALLVYLGTRLVGLVDYPVYFFSDEAVQPLLAADFIRDNFKNADGDFMPTYFYNVDKYSLGTTVYLHLLTYVFFGKSALATRVVSVLATLMAAVCIGLILRDAFKLPYWWVGTLLLSIAPAWFLHSRTAFEVVTMVSLYCGALYFYLLYRYRNPRFLYWALLLFALAFYCYNPAQVIVTVTGLLLLLSDLRYHWQNRKVALLGLFLLMVLAVPFIRFRLDHPEAVQEHLTNLSSYWLQPIPIREKLARYWDQYLYGLGWSYWFVPNRTDLVRHLMKGYAHLHTATLPFWFLGLAVIVRNFFRSSAHRAVLVASLAGPTGAAVAQIAVTRALVMVVAYSLVIALGIIALLQWLEKKHMNRMLASLVLFVFLCLVNLNMARAAVADGPTWYQDYSLSGMQYGGIQMFGAVEDYLDENPGAHLVVSPSWANGSDVVARFFLGDPLPVQLGSTSDYLYRHLPLDPDMVFVATPEEYTLLIESGKFSRVDVEKVVPYPNGRPGFYFLRMQYVDNIDEILSVELEARRELVQDEVILDGQLVKIGHSLLDIGKIPDLWDGNERTLARTFEANPFIIQMTFPLPRQLSGLSMKIGDTDVRIVAYVYLTEESEPIQFSAELTGTVQDTWVTIDFGQTLDAKVLRLEITDLRQGEPGHMHIWEIEFQ